MISADDFNGKFTKVKNKQIIHAKRASFSIIAKAQKLELPVDLHLHFFDTCILPILLYGSEIWGFFNIHIQNINVFHNQYCKNLLKIGSKSINSITLEELGHYRIEKFIKQRMLNV